MSKSSTPPPPASLDLTSMNKPDTQAKPHGTPDVPNDGALRLRAEHYVLVTRDDDGMMVTLGSPGQGKLTLVRPASVQDAEQARNLVIDRMVEILKDYHGTL